MTRAYSHTANSYGAPITLTHILLKNDLMGIEDIPYSFVHFEEGFSVLRDTVK